LSGQPNWAHHIQPSQEDVHLAGFKVGGVAAPIVGGPPVMKSV
jgi:hypothetical protein